MLEFIEHKEYPNIFFINANSIKDKIDLGALLSRYSRTHKSAKQLYQEEFLDNPDRGSEFYRKVFGQYGDESISELVPNGFAVGLERIPVAWSTNLLHYRMLSAIEKSTRYMKALEFWKPDDAPEYYTIRCNKRMEKFNKVSGHAFSKLDRKYTHEVDKSVRHTGDSRAIHSAMRSKSLDYARMELPMSTITSLGIVANLRSWLNILSKLMVRHKFSLMSKYVLNPLYDLFMEHFPTIFNKIDDLVQTEDYLEFDYDYNLQTQKAFKSEPNPNFEIIDATAKYRVNTFKPFFRIDRAKKHKMRKHAEMIDITINIPKIDYATFRDVQRHRFFSIYHIPNNKTYRNVWDLLSSPMATTANLVIKANLREWTHAIELRTQPPGHYKYRQLFQRCGKLIADYIGLPKEVCFPFANWQSDQEVQLGRTQAELKRLVL